MTPPESPVTAESATTRFEAFSDGVFAIAITLLVLEIRLPGEREIEALGGLAPALLALWPSYVGYVISFVTIGIMWANHHNVIKLIASVDHGLIVWNLLLLMAISFTPFPTAVMADYLPHAGRDRTVAVAFYCGSFTLTACFYNLLWLHASRGRRLLHAHVSDERVRAITRAYWPGTFLYAMATAAALVNVAAALVIVAGLALFYILPRRGAHL
ncbi:MAG TPA: TMEM175 family protein [Vicinamibacterales bacterium]|jgi:uncharacterized membrane protein|nr:TMEM175 family protein [Vicinamibacterales bacterium]